MRSMRAATSAVSSSSCLSAVARNGSEEAMKSTRRPGSSMFIAMVCSSSESVGEAVTICWNWAITFRCSASSSALLPEPTSGMVSTVAIMNGSIVAEFAQPDALRALGEDEEALVGHLDDFVHRRQGADGVQVAGLRGVHARVALRDHHDGLLLSQRLNELDGAFPADGQGQHGVGKQHRVANRQNGQDPSL